LPPIADASARLIDGLGDVTIDGTPADNELLAFDTASGEWINQTAAEAGLGGGVTDLGDLADVTDTSAAAGWFLRSDGATSWVTQLGITSRGDIPSAIAYEDEANVFTLANTFEGTTPTTLAIATKDDGDADNRLEVRADGRISWGDGTLPVDTWIERSAKEVLDTNADFLLSRTTRHSTITLQRNAGLEANLLSKTASAIRWELQLASGEAESTGDLGSNFKLIRYDDAGTTEVDALTIQRDDGATVIGGSLAWGGGAVVSSSDDISIAELQDIGDVDAYSSLAIGEILRWSGTGWQHRTPLEANIAVINAANTFGAGPQLILGAGSTSVSLASRLSADTYPRIQILAGGKIEFGTGGADVYDTNLYRSTTDTLKTDDAFTWGGGQTIGSSDDVATYGGSGPFTVDQILSSVSPQVQYKFSAAPGGTLPIGPSLWDSGGVERVRWASDNTDFFLQASSGGFNTALVVDIGWERVEFPSTKRPALQGSAAAGPAIVGSSAYGAFDTDDLDYFADVTYTTGPAAGDFLKWVTDHWEPTAAVPWSASAGDLYIDGTDSITINIDSDANSTAEFFRIQTNSTGMDGGTELLYLDDDGSIWMEGPITFGGSQAAPYAGIIFGTSGDAASIALQAETDMKFMVDTDSNSSNSGFYWVKHTSAYGHSAANVLMELLENGTYSQLKVGSNSVYVSLGQTAANTFTIATTGTGDDLVLDTNTDNDNVLLGGKTNVTETFSSGTQKGHIVSLSELTTSVTAPTSSAHPIGALWGVYT
jgi:hypothetical protein